MWNGELLSFPNLSRSIVYIFWMGRGWRVCKRWTLLTPFRLGTNPFGIFVTHTWVLYRWIGIIWLKSIMCPFRYAFSFTSFEWKIPKYQNFYDSITHCLKCALVWTLRLCGIQIRKVFYFPKTFTGYERFYRSLAS